MINHSRGCILIGTERNQNFESQIQIFLLIDKNLCVVLALFATLKFSPLPSYHCCLRQTHEEVSAEETLIKETLSSSQIYRLFVVSIQTPETQGASQ